MSFRPSESLAIAIVPILAGGYLLLDGRALCNIALQEVVTRGEITHIYHQTKSGPTYEYLFEVNGVRVTGGGITCQTPTTARGCNEGGLVRVYYDPNDLSKTRLQDFGDAGRGKLAAGTLMAGAGLLFIGMNFLVRITEKDSDDANDSDDSDDSTPDEKSDVIHIVPGE
jgi:hypothetical protein